MRWTSVAILCLLAGCTTSARPYSGPGDVHLNRGPNPAPRGSDEFCRNYGAQTTTSRIENSRKPNGGGANGFDYTVAAQEGDRAYQRCRAGKLN